MKSVIVISAWLMAACVALSSASAVPERADVEGVALEYVRTSKPYMDDGGFGEEITEIELGDEISTVSVHFQTRIVGMLQVIGDYRVHLVLNSTDLTILRSMTEATQGSEVPVTNNGTTDASGDPDEGGGIDEEAWRLKILYAINRTRSLIEDNSDQFDLEEASAVLSRAEESLASGQFEIAMELAMEATSMVERILNPDGEDVPPDPKECPWIYGYIVVFRDEPTDAVWQDLGSGYNATKMGSAEGYTEENHAYWVRVENGTPEDLRALESVNDVIVLRSGGDLIQDGDAGNEDMAVPEPVMVVCLILGLLAGRLSYSSR